MQSVLAGAGEVLSFPFPHLEIENALPDDIYQELYRTFPKFQLSKGNNSPIPFRAHQIVARLDCPDVWKELVLFHTSKEFFEQVNDLFRLGLSGDVGMRKSQKARIRMECQCIGTSAVTRPTSVKGPHYDNPETKWAGILYFRDPADDAGGHLQLYHVPKPRFTKKRFTDNHGEPVKTIPYEPNRFIGWVNNEHAIHGVTVRNVTDISRRYVNFTVDA